MIVMPRARNSMAIRAEVALVAAAERHRGRVTLWADFGLK